MYLFRARIFLQLGRGNTKLTPFRITSIPQPQTGFCRLEGVRGEAGAQARQYELDPCPSLPEIDSTWRPCIPACACWDPAQGHTHWRSFRPLAPPRGCSVTSGLSEGRPRPPLAPGRCTPPALHKSPACAHRATAALRRPHPPSSSNTQLASGTMQPAMLLGLLGAAALAGEWGFSTSDSSCSLLSLLFPLSLALPGFELGKLKLSRFFLLSPQGLCSP